MSSPKTFSSALTWAPAAHAPGCLMRPAACTARLEVRLGGDVRAYHDRKSRLYHRMYDQLRYGQLMRG